VPHTVEEAYELADAAHSGDDAKLIDELGDVLFQVHFLALLAEERGAGDLAAVADACREKLIRRHPHVFGTEAAETAEAVLRTWGRIKREDERGGEVFGDLPDNLPAPLYARKVIKRAASAGLYDVPGGAGGSFEEHGEVLMAAVEAAHADGVDPELALRAAADRFKADREGASS